MVDVSARARRRAARARVGVIVGATPESDPYADWYGPQQVQDPVDFPAPSTRPAVESVVSRSQGVVAYPGRGGLSEDASADPATGELPVVEPEHITETTCRIPVISSADLTGPIPRIAGELFTPPTPWETGWSTPRAAARRVAQPGFRVLDGDRAAVARPSAPPPVTDLPGVVAPTGTWPDAAPPASRIPGRARPSWIRARPLPRGWSRDQDDLGRRRRGRAAVRRTVGARDRPRRRPRRRADHRADPRHRPRRR